jgi:hypothetical protein
MNREPIGTGRLPALGGCQPNSAGADGSRAPVMRLLNSGQAPAQHFDIGTAAGGRFEIVWQASAPTTGEVETEIAAAAEADPAAAEVTEADVAAAEQNWSDAPRAASTEQTELEIAAVDVRSQHGWSGL